MPDQHDHAGEVQLKDVLDVLMDIKGDTAQIPALKKDVDDLKVWRVEVDAERNQRLGASAMRKGFFGGLLVSAGWLASHVTSLFGSK